MSVATAQVLRCPTCSDVVLAARADRPHHDEDVALAIADHYATRRHAVRLVPAQRRG